MTDSLDNKSKEKRDKLDVDLDAMLDEAESSLAPSNEFDDDEDAIDRLLMNVGFDVDDELAKIEANKHVPVVKNEGFHDELDDFLSFEGFGATLNELEENQAVELDQTIEKSPFTPLDEAQDDEDALDGLLMSADLGADDALAGQAGDEDVDALEELDDFSDFSDFNESEGIQSSEVDETVQSVGSSSAVETDELDDFFGLGNDFDDAKLIQEDETPAAVEIIDTAVVEEVQDDFADFSGFDEPEIVPTLEPDEAEPVTEHSLVTNDASLEDELDDFFGLGNDFDEADLIQEDETPAAVEIIDTPVVEEAQDDFADFSGFDESEIVSMPEVDEVELSAENLSADEVDASADLVVADAELLDEEDDFSSLMDGFDETDLLQDDQVEASADSVADEQATVADAELLDEEDDFSSLMGGFDEADLLQDDELDASADLGVDNEGLLEVDDESFNGLQDDENSFDSLFMDAGFDAEDGLEQTTGKEEAFGDDTDLSEIDSFFQLDEVSDDFSKQMEGDQLEATETVSDQGDDFLLPDFDITADSETPVADIKDDEFADVFGDTENDAMQAFGAENAQPKTTGNEAVAESASKQAIGTAVEDVGDVKLNPFGFEQEDLKKQLEEAEKKLKKAKLLGYVALGFGAVALSAAAGLGVMTYTAKTEVSKLTEAVSTLETNLAKSAANNPSEEVDSMRNSVVQLNQQVDGFITELKGNPQFPVDLLNNKVPDIAAKQDMVSKALDMLQVKIGSLEEKAATTVPPVAEVPKIEVSHEPVTAKEENTHEVAPVKSEIGHEHAQAKEDAAHELVPSKEAAAHEPASTKTVAEHESAPTKEAAVHEHEPNKEKVMHETSPAKADTAPEVAAAKLKTQPEAITVKPPTAEKIVAKEKPVEVPKQVVPGKWGVNLGAFNQEWFAKSKAAEYARQGIFADVVPVPGKNAMMYRLRVGGFKSKAEASSNTARIKQALSLDSVWVSDN